jgi:penicillin amidase
MRRRGSTLLKWLPMLMVGGALAGCALLKPLPKQASLDQRLAMFPTDDLPLEEPVTIRWDEHQIPFIEAATDEDAAFALGLVHAHLRLGQMAVFRRVAQGRISEIGGPLARDIDHGVRLLDFGRASHASFSAMPEPTRIWLRRFVEGINHYQARMETTPHEYAVLGLEREPWTPEDVLTFGRLAGSDVNWLVWFNLLKLRSRPDWPQIWARVLSEGGDRAMPPGPDAQQASDGLDGILAALSRSGSNSLAVGSSRTKTGSAILANDPHLGINLPNTWLIAGLRSPSYDVVGLMVPGLPLFAIGRNTHIAWGGTNMRAYASDLVDVRDLPEGKMEGRRETIGVRWWVDDEVVIRETPYGPVLADAPQLEELGLPDFALRWTGHQPSDEVTAMLAVARANDFDSFREALSGFAVPGQNMLYADVSGNVGKVFAVRLPDRSSAPADLVVAPDESERNWVQLRDVRDLPVVFNPLEGFVASANNRPQVDGADVGWFFSPDDRVRRMAALVEAEGAVDVPDIKMMQRDVYVESSSALNSLLVRKMHESGIADRASDEARRVLDLMATWDGTYAADSQQPVAFELFRHAFTQGFYQASFGASGWAAFAGVAAIKTLLIQDIEARPAESLASMLAESLDAAGKKLSHFPTWGDMHRLQLRHPLSFLPVIGGRYAFVDEPIGGSTDSLMKTAHPATDERHRTSYGANARHISDLGDPDRNWFVLLGGQDGWLNSTTFLDQVPLWLDGRYVEVPMRPQTVQRRFRFVSELRP